jgi:hypothetical protein
MVLPPFLREFFSAEIETVFPLRYGLRYDCAAGGLKPRIKSRMLPIPGTFVD